MTKLIGWTLGLTLLAVGFTVAIMPLVFFQSYVVCDLWGLFVGPWLHFAPPSSVWVMAGVILMFRIMTHGHVSFLKKEEPKEEKSFGEAMKGLAKPILISYLTTLAIWGFGHVFFWLSV